MDTKGIPQSVLCRVAIRFLNPQIYFSLLDTEVPGNPWYVENTFCWGGHLDQTDDQMRNEGPEEMNI